MKTDNNMQSTIATLSALFGVTDVRQQNEHLFFVTSPGALLPSLFIHLRDKEGFTHLTFLTAVDFIENRQFQLTYMLHNYGSGMSLAVLVFIGRDNPTIQSIHTLWEQARVFQQELREMFGIDFPGSPRIEENFALEGWQDMPPMRRDFNTREYSEKTFFPRPGRHSENPREYMKKKLYPDNRNDV
jgi:NADH-quinone oxidoreductase subunit C